MTEAPPPPPTTTTLEQFGVERLATALRQRPDVTAALARAVTCAQAVAAHDALVPLGQTRTAGTLRMVHHQRCRGLHDWRLEKALPWDEPTVAARMLAAIICAPGVVERVAEAWLSPPSELELVIRALGCNAEADRWVDACQKADDAFWATRASLYAFDPQVDR